MNIPEFIIVHHLAFRGEAGVKEVRSWHIERGFTNIGYHYIIRKDGRIETGRYEHVQGAHCRGYNEKSVGIAMEGHHNFDTWTLQQTYSFKVLVAFLRLKYAIPVSKVVGHRELAKTECPGLLIDMDEVRALC